MTDRPRYMLAAILVVGILVRLALLLLFDPSTQGGDSDYYLAVASSILDHGVHGQGGDPGFFRVPLYPAFLAVLGAIFGLAWQPIIVAQCSITVSAAAIAYLSLRASGDRYGPWWALLIAASPFGALMDFRITAESVTSNLLLILLTFCYVRRSAVTSKRAVAIGIALGALALTRETYLLLPLVLLPTLWLVFRCPIRSLAIVLAAFLITITPWVVRNAALENGGPFLSKGTLGVNLWIGTWERDGAWTIGGMPRYAFASKGERREFARHSKPVDDDYFSSLAIERIKAEPAHVAATWIRRIPAMWIGTRTELNKSRLARGSLGWAIMKSLFWAANALLLIAAMIGMAITIFRKREYLLFAAPVGYVVAIYLPFHSAETRYSVAAVPFLILFAIVAARSALQVISNYRGRTA